MSSKLIKTICKILLCSLCASLLAGCGGKQVGNDIIPVASVSETTSVAETTTESTPAPTPTPTPTPPLMMLTAEQRNSVCMLNYITVLTQEINSSKNSRLFLENAYTYLVNNIDLNAIDKRTQTQILSLLDLMEGYRMLNVKRERLAYVYEQNKAQALRSAIPNPLALLSAAQSYRPGKLALSIVYMAVDSATSYAAYSQESELEYLQDGWALDDEEAQQLHNSRKGLFSYAVNMVRENSIPSDLVLTEKTVEEFVKWKNDDNTTGRIRFLESNKETYLAYGGYWLVLAESYYEAGEYDKCLSAIQEYQAMQTRIFRKDYELARILPLAIAAADEVQNGKEYESSAVSFAQLIESNTDSKDWNLRYFAAQTYVDLYAKINNKAYLEKAYEITLNNTNNLVDEQYSLNRVYLDPVAVLEKPKDSTKEEKKEIDEHNKALKALRKVELPPVCEPLLVNCELLFALADMLDISQQQKDEISRILRTNPEDQLYLCLPLEQHFHMNNKTEIAVSQYDLTCYADNKYASLFLPVSLLSDGVEITVEFKSGGTSLRVSDWYVAEVDRNKSDDVDDFVAQIIFSWGDKAHFESGDRAVVSVLYPGSEQTREQLDFTLTARKKVLGSMVFEQ